MNKDLDGHGKMLVGDEGGEVLHGEADEDQEVREGEERFKNFGTINGGKTKG